MILIYIKYNLPILLLFRLCRYNRAYHNSIEWVNGVFMVGKWLIESNDTY